MTSDAFRKAWTAGTLLALALGLGALAPAAAAHHDNPARLCEEKFEGGFNSFRKYPIFGRHGARLGRLDISFQGPVRRHGVWGWRACAVTVLNHHNRLRFADAGVRQADDRRWRSDPGMWRRYAGPVVRWSPYAGNCLIWRGTIRGGTNILKGYCP
jgi:hypothetical protein